MEKNNTDCKKNCKTQLYPNDQPALKIRQNEDWKTETLEQSSTMPSGMR